MHAKESNVEVLAVEPVMTEQAFVIGGCFPRKGRRMVIKKYRQVEDMESPPKLVPLDPNNIRIACELTELAFAFHPWVYEPGVKKYHSSDEAYLARKEWENRQVRKRRK